MKKIDIGVLIILCLIYILIIGYVITMVIISIPNLLKKKQPVEIPPPPPQVLPRFDPSLAPKIPLGQSAVRYDEQKIHE